VKVNGIVAKSKQLKKHPLSGRPAYSPYAQVLAQQHKFSKASQPNARPKKLEVRKDTFNNVL